MKRIAFFDSGIGGLSVMQEALVRLPYESYVYYADTDNVPYGTKSSEQIEQCVSAAAVFLSQFNLKALVIACNTATSVVIKKLRQDFAFPIIGMEPAIKPAALSNKKKVLLCATEKTLAEEKLSHLITDLNIDDRVEKVSLQELVMYGENFDFNNPLLRTYLQEAFQSVEWEDFGSLVLGCTHFLFFKKHLQSIIPSHIQIIDGNTGTINRLGSLIDLNTQSITSDLVFYQSGREVAPVYYDHYLRYIKENI